MPRSTKSKPVHSNRESGSRAASSLLKAGDPAPRFKLRSDEGDEVSLQHFKGKKLVLYFYPKDNTPGCTQEACAFRDGLEKIKKKGAAVVGISADSVEAHRKFKDKQDLNFPLLSDETRQVIEAYGVWKEKSLYGRKFMGIERTTFIVDEKGRIGKVFPKVRVANHFQEVLDAL